MAIPLKGPKALGTAADPAASMVPTAARRTYAETWGTMAASSIDKFLMGAGRGH